MCQALSLSTGTLPFLFPFCHHPNPRLSHLPIGGIWLAASRPTCPQHVMSDEISLNNWRDVLSFRSSAYGACFLSTTNSAPNSCPWFSSFPSTTFPPQTYFPIILTSPFFNWQNFTHPSRLEVKYHLLLAKFLFPNIPLFPFRPPETLPSSTIYSNGYLFQLASHLDSELFEIRAHPFYFVFQGPAECRCSINILHGMNK